MLFHLIGFLSFFTQLLLGRIIRSPPFLPRKTAIFPVEVQHGMFEMKRDDHLEICPKKPPVEKLEVTKVLIFERLTF